LSCPLRVVLRTLRPTLRDDTRMIGTNTSRIHASLPPIAITTPTSTTMVKNCWKKSISTVAIAVCTRSTSLISVEISVPDGCS
jgi:Flp pilus assembly CpaF family ATPase